LIRRTEWLETIRVYVIWIDGRRRGMTRTDDVRRRRMSSSKLMEFVSQLQEVMLSQGYKAMAAIVIDDVIVLVGTAIHVNSLERFLETTSTVGKERTFTNVGLIHFRNEMGSGGVDSGAG
jgi:hypothetical protein